MFLGFILLLTFCANIWLGWNLGYPLDFGGWFSLPAGLLVFLVTVPIVAIFSGIGGVALGLVGMLFGKHNDHTRGRRFLRSFLKGWGWLTVIIWMLPWMIFGIFKLSNDLAPASLPRITITNGEKIVIFQSMMHIASPGFYEDIRKDMEQLRDEDYVFFYEGVRKGSEESLNKLGKLMGTEISESMYDTLAEVGDLVFQGDEEYTDILPSMNVDLSTDDIVSLADESTISAPLQKQIDLAQILRVKYPSFTPFQKYVTQVIARGMMNLVLHEYTDPRLTSKLKSTIPVFEIILDKRNTTVVEAITTSANEHIYIHYGAMHFSGILDGLQKKDPRWHEIGRKEYVVIR